MDQEYIEKFKRLKSLFEGKIGVYQESWVIKLVRVYNLRLTSKPYIEADVEEVPTKGLNIGNLAPRRWKIGAGSYSYFSDASWHAGYAMWSIYFSHEIIEEVTLLASRFPEEMTYMERYLAISAMLSRPKCERIFLDIC